MKIRFAKDTDISELKLIWKVCFGDSDEYINFFFDNMFKPENAVVADIDGRASGVVHLLDAKFYDTPFKYGYAIGVLPEFRGNSLCKKMHDFIRDYCEKNSFMYGLHPANDKLAEFYKSIGLNDMFSLKIKEYVNDTENNDEFEISDISPDEYFNLRESHFKPLVSWGKDTIVYMMNEAKHFGGFAKKIYIDGNEKILLVKKYNDEIIIKETTMSDSDILRANNCIKKYFCGKKVTYILPNTSMLTETSKTTIYGFNEKNDNVYMNLYFD